MPASDHSVDVDALSDEQLAQLRRDVLHAIALRKQIGTSPEKIEAAIAEYQVASGKGQGEPWEQPVTALQAYREGAEVTYDGETWRSLHHANPHRPGEALWRLVPETDEDGNEIPPRYVQPSSAADAYPKGRRITHNGQIWEAVRDGVVHSPDEYAPDWQLVEEGPDPEPEPPGDDDEPVDPEPEPEEDQPDEWVQPGGHNPYNTGDRVTYNGAIYVSVMDGNVWSPSAHPAGWERQE